MRRHFDTVAVFLILGLAAVPLNAQDLLRTLGRQQDFKSHRVSSFDRSGGNNDRLAIAPGKTAVLAEIEGPAAIHHIWVTIAGEAFYGRKIILRMYWDGETRPSVEAPIGDFFGVGHGLNRDLSALAIACSSEGRARNCYWHMPFRGSARITASNEGESPVGAFYYYIDYRALPELSPDVPYFHAQYRQEMPCTPGQNYVFLEAEGQGHYVGCNLSILQRAMGWWGEGDDMIYVDGEDFPSLYGTGSEDYFSDAWGMREGENLFYGCPLQEPDFKTGSKATVYRHHIPDPIPFLESIRVTIEHGHANDRSDYFSSVAYWYQTEPHAAFPQLPSVEERLPFALESPGLGLPVWEEKPGRGLTVFMDSRSRMAVAARRLVPSLTSFYNPGGERYPVLSTDEAQTGDEIAIFLDAAVGEHYDLELFFLQGHAMGEARVLRIEQDEWEKDVESPLIQGYAEGRRIAQTTLRDVRLQQGTNRLILGVTGQHADASGGEFGFVGLRKTPSRPHFIQDWNLIGPFDAPDMSYLQSAFPPEEGVDVSQSYSGKDGLTVKWTRFAAPESGWVRLEDLIQPKEQAVAYGFTYVYAPEERSTQLLIGSDDGVRIWLNGDLVHTNPAYRGAYPDQDRIPVHLKQGWNTLLVKVLQGSGGWGYYIRFADPEHTLVYSAVRKQPGSSPFEENDR
ncbi:MAG: glycoside hydrolase family 172 protein [Candidatus Aminicenantaceae bacterium]